MELLAKLWDHVAKEWHVIRGAKGLVFLVLLLGIGIAIYVTSKVLSWYYAGEIGNLTAAISNKQSTIDELSRESKDPFPHVASSPIDDPPTASVKPPQPTPPPPPAQLAQPSQSPDSKSEDDSRRRLLMFVRNKYPCAAGFEMSGLKYTISSLTSQTTSTIASSIFKSLLNEKYDIKPTYGGTYSTDMPFPEFTSLSLRDLESEVIKLHDNYTEKLRFIQYAISNSALEKKSIPYIDLWDRCHDEMRDEWAKLIQDPNYLDIAEKLGTQGIPWGLLTKRDEEIANGK